MSLPPALPQQPCVSRDIVTPDARERERIRDEIERDRKGRTDATAFD